MKPTQEKIFKTAIDLFSQSGYNGVSIRQIAKVVGIKESSIYNHFQNKDNILETIYDYYKQEMKKTTLSIEELDKKIGTMPFEQFWTIGLSNFHKKTEDPLLEKINNIILLEMFRDERARDIALSELFQRQQNIVCQIFKKMQDKGIIKSEFDPKVLAQEYTYPLLGLRFEYNILKSWNLDTKEVQKKMFDHIKFFSANVRSVTGDEASE
jgi:AcrR family transcriptional regulator